LKRTLVHVGLHRTGTTFLQKHVFPQLNVNFIHVKGVDILKKHKLDNKNSNVLSSEYFSGNPWNFDNENYGSNDRYKIADKIKEMYPDANILLVLRNQDDWKRSLYNQYKKSKGYLSREEFDKKFDDEYLNFVDYSNYLIKTFGIDKVHILQYENLKKDYKGFIREICKILDVNIPYGIKNAVYNKSLTKGQEKILKKLRNISDFTINKIKFGMERMNR